MLTRGGVPVRQNQRRDFPFSGFVDGGIPLAVNDVVLGIRGIYRAGETKYFPVKLEIGGGAIGEKLVTRLQHRFVEDAQVFGWSVTVAWIFLGRGPAAGPIETPIKRPDHAIGRAEAKAVLPILHPSCVKGIHLSTTSVAGVAV